MATSDSAFLWETEALRSARPTLERAAQSDWITLREAHDQTGIAVSTLRRWARKDLIPSYLEPFRDGQLRMVSKSAVERRAADLGRVDDAIPDGTVDHERRTLPSAPSPPPPPKTESSETPPGTMLVPIDAWDKMLMQLGNLHQAGQDLAEARERAARAETEVRFLKERLAEKRAADEKAAESRPDPRPASPPPSADHAPPATGKPMPTTAPTAKSKTPGFTRLMWRAWRTRPKG
jgi:hypothetical protein